MSEIAQTIQLRETAPLPVEHVAPPKERYTDILYLNLGNATSFSGPISLYLEDYLDGCGQVNLLSLAIRYRLPAETDYIRFGSAAVSSSATVEQLSKKRNGLDESGNGFVKGKSFVVEHIPMSNISRRVQPPSASEPMLKLAFEKSATCAATIIFTYEVVGIREHHELLSNISAVAGTADDDE